MLDVLVCTARNYDRLGALQSFEGSGPGNRIHTDLTGPNPVSRQGAIYIFVANNAFTIFLVAVSLRNKSAITLTTVLVYHVFLPFWNCRSIVTDRGTQFCNNLLAKFSQILGIRKPRTTAYRASATGRVERVHRILNNLLCKVVSEDHKDWQEKLPMIVATHNAAQH